jgi:F0F1-type ATP synthase membrane subunit c/vacuolar-type H+-ATPase subunit K
MKFSEMSPKARKRLLLIWVLVVPIIALSTTVLVFAATQALPTATATTTTVTATATDQVLDWTTVFLALSAFGTITTSAWAASYALAKTGAAAIAGGVEKPDTFFKSFLVVTLCEAIAIYGLVVAILLWTRIPAV